jgi:hypothetical protein
MANFLRGTCALCSQRTYITEADGLCSQCQAIKKAAEFDAKATPEQKKKAQQKEIEALCNALPFTPVD